MTCPDIKGLSFEELAQYLKLQKQTIYNWLNQNKISGIKIGGVWRFDKKKIDKWLKSQARKVKNISENQTE